MHEPCSDATNAASPPDRPNRLNKVDRAYENGPNKEGISSVRAVAAVTRPRRTGTLNKILTPSLAIKETLTLKCSSAKRRPMRSTQSGPRVLTS